ncbi:MAG: HIT family protein [Thermoflexaceae bacterium]|nr:HIT family protein [Thermoflexaceae bacterium]
MKKEDCIFCKIANGIIPSPAIYEDEDFKVILDRGPASKGHALVLPKEHFDNVFSMDEEHAGKVFKVAARVACAINASFDCDGINILQNNGEAAGQSVFHFHMHIIPRYKDDKISLGWTPGEITDEQVAEFADTIHKNMN